MGQAKRLGLLAKELFVIISTPAAGIDLILEQLEAHLAFQAKLEKDGVMFAAGPLSTTDGSTWDGTGLFIYHAESLQAAAALAQHDPLHSSGARTFKAHAWMLNEGTLSIHASYSRGQLDIT
jgi:uncharacterized protein YciI